MSPPKLAIPAVRIQASASDIKKFPIYKFGEVEFKSNNLKADKISGSPGCTQGKHDLRIVPDVYKKDCQFASITLKTTEFLDLLCLLIPAKQIGILAGGDSDSAEAPDILQRIPTTDRIRKINDALRTQEVNSIVETLKIGVFGCTVEADGIRIDDHTFLALNDGGGRSSALWANYQEVSRMLRDVIAHTKNVYWQLNLNLSGKLSSNLNEFIRAGRDAKHITSGTRLGVETSYRRSLEEEGIEIPEEYDNVYYRTKLVEQLFNYPLGTSFTQFFRWKYEGNASKADDYQGTGTQSSISTALKELVPVLKKSSIKPSDLPLVLNFGLVNLYKRSPGMVKDASGDNVYHLTKTLGIKLTFVLIIKAFEMSGYSDVKFMSAVETILTKHFHLFKKHEYRTDAQKIKKMTFDKFFVSSSWFNTKAFNSGMANTTQLLSGIISVADDVAGKKKAE